VRRGLALALALSLAPLTASAWCRTTTSRTRGGVANDCNMVGVPLAWRSRCTGYSLFRTGLPANLTWQQMVDITRASSSSWASATCDENGLERQYFEVRELAPTLALSGWSTTGANANTISFRSKWGDDALHREGVIAITIVSYDSFTGEIFDGDIEMNTYNDRTNQLGFEFSTSRLPGPDAVDLQTIIVHELGHFHGIAHSSNDRAIMWPEAGRGEARRDLTSDDAAGICAAYPPAAAPVGVRCNPVPYGGLATLPGGTEVVGAKCSARPGARGDGFAGALVALAALAGGVKKSRRGRRTSTGSEGVNAD
jgi:hypothetical protein